MGVISLVILIFFLPFVWFLWTGMSTKSGKIEKVHWKKPMAALVALVLLSFGLNYYFSNAYELSFFQNGFESILALIISAAFLVVVTIVNVVVSIKFKGAPKSIHNPKAVWILTAGLCTTILFFTIWVYPLAEKASYIHTIERALAAAEQQQDPEEITVVFMGSEKNCIRTSTSNCDSVTYKNSFFLKNNLETQKEVQVQIRAMNSKKEELKVIESEIMTLEAGELKLLETEETSDVSSIWSRSSFETEYRTQFYEYLFRYRDVN